MAELEDFKKLCKDLEKRSKKGDVIQGDLFEALSERFGSRFIKAWEAVNERRVKKYSFKPSGKTLWIVVGRKREYIVLPDVHYCSCNDFYYKVMNRESFLCYHLIACHLARATRSYDLIREEDALYNFLLNDWKK